jgi:hypothetical protein
MILALLYFHPIRGPEVFFSYPEDVSDKIRAQMRGFFDLDMSDKFFEVTLIEENTKITNLYFEITSCLARGNMEMVMLSVITDKDYQSELFYESLKDYSSRIASAINIYKAFYTEGFLKQNDLEVEEKGEELNSLLTECFNDLESKVKQKLEGGAIVKKFKKFKW